QAGPGRTSHLARRPRADATIIMRDRSRGKWGRADGGRSIMITLEQAERIIDAILVRARELNLRPMSAVVVEPGASVKAFKKEDGSSMLRFEMAVGKAYASLALGRSSSLVRLRAEERPIFMDFLHRASDGKMFPEGGGMLIRDQDG